MDPGANINKYFVQKLQMATKEKLRKFNSLRGREVACGEFWDAVVVTSADERQKYAYELQIKEKVDRKELPFGVHYKVFSDPPGYKIGNGGSTLYALQHLSDIFGKTLCRMRVIMIHAGGSSQRLPSASALGKIFTAVPLGEPLYQMLELKLAMYVDLPNHMKPGVLVTCADDIELYSIAEGERVALDKPGFTALAHPSPLSIGTTHGVFVLKPSEDAEWSEMENRTCLRFLHKPSIETMRDTGAVFQRRSDCFPLSDAEFVYTDSTYYVDFDTSQRLLGMLKEVAPLECEIDAYGDFLQALGPLASIEYTRNTANVTKEDDGLVEIRQKIFRLLRGMPLNVVLLNNSKFYHLGTTREYVFHLTGDDALKSELGVLSSAFSVGPDPKTDATSCVMHSVLKPNCSLGAGSVVEYSRLGEGVSVGRDSVLSSCWVNPGSSVPDGVFMHSLCVTQQNRSVFVTVAFGIDDNLKRCVKASASLDSLTLFGVTLEACVTFWGLDCHDLKFSGDVSSLWTACLFPVCEDQERSFSVSLSMLQAVLDRCPFNLPKDLKLISMHEALQCKNLKEMLNFRKGLYHDITQRS
ncbi:fucose-1-phosphate guanylyltransferase isoform X1 [Syngnathus typhle]|uniref:fucose-1-phosphate guanylyltransferase isoform X1 n=1 Tax=Syngnathus typhle TaxID=161592 RepID=UPI002A6B3CDC|nr:fucose-1-phosphate guanylyltransferase isoform X1 [Syngnathus typhle]